MQEKLRGFLDGILVRWNELENGQRIRLIATIIVIIGVLGAVAYFATKPNMVTLATTANYSEAQQIQAALDEAGIKNSMAKGGTAILVRDADVDKAQVALVDKNIPKTNGFTWADALDASGMGATETIKKENIRRAAETSLAQKIVQFDGVEAATVTLVLPDDNNFFIESKQQASVGVLLTTSKPLNSNQSLAIARQIRMSVKGLEMENIEISNQDMEILYSGSEQETKTLGSGYDMEVQRKKEIESKIRAALSPLFQDVRVISNISLKMDQSKIETQTITPPVADSQNGVIIREEISKQNATNTTTDAEPGLAPNTNTAPTYQTQNQGNSSASSSESIIDYGYNTQKTVIDGSVGTLIPDQSSVSVFAYTYKNYDQEYMTKNNLLNGQRWEDFKAAQAGVPIAIDQGIIDSLKIGTGIDNLSIVAYERPTFTDQEVKPLQINQIVMFGILALLIILLAVGLIKKTQADEVTEVEPELSVEDLLVSTQLEEEKEEEMRLKDISYLKDSETKLQIEKFVLEKPESVAQLLRNWLNDEWE